MLVKEKWAFRLTLTGVFGIVDQFNGQVHVAALFFEPVFLSDAAPRVFVVVLGLD